MANENKQPDRKSVAVQDVDATGQTSGLGPIMRTAAALNASREPLVVRGEKPLPAAPAGVSVLDLARKVNESSRPAEQGSILAAARRMNEKKARDER